MTEAADIRTHPMPPRVADLPRDPRQYPIFFTIQQPNGRYNFLAVVPEQIVKCAVKRLCGICGQEMGYWIHFVGGPISCSTRAFSEPPMHLDCLEYAMAVCPFLARDNYRRIEERADRPARDEIMSDPAGTPLEPARFAIYRTRQYKFVIDPNGVPLFLASPAREIRWKEKGSHDNG